MLMLSRLTFQKGIDILVNVGNRRPFDSAERMKGIINLGFNIIICGIPSGGMNGVIHQELKKTEKQNKDNMVYLDYYSDELACELLSGSDMLIHPSNFEPCGLTPMYAMQFGTVPIVTNVGGLSDIVKDYKQCDNSNGFMLENTSFEKLYETLEFVRQIYNENEKWEQLICRCMTCDYGWESSIQKYIEVIEDIL